MQIRSVGIDLGKTTFHLVALGDTGKVLLKKKFTQKQLIAFTANLQTTLIGLEACGGAHFLGRTLCEQGHDVKLIPAQFVKPFVKSNKNDFIDAEAIDEAADRQNMRFVLIKTDDQLDLQALHRVRDRLITRRTSVINQLRAFLLERGLVFAKSPAKRGNLYLRKILIHGARAVVLRFKRERIAMGAWMTSLETRASRNVLIVATANKLARIAWAVLSSGQDYRGAGTGGCLARCN